MFDEQIHIMTHLCIACTIVHSALEIRNCKINKIQESRDD